MVKQLIIFVLLSLLVVLFLPQIHLLLHYIDIFYRFLLSWLNLVIAGGPAGRALRNFIALIIIPLLIGLILSLPYWATGKNLPPQYMSFVWFSWLILVILLAYKIV